MKCFADMNYSEESFFSCRLLYGLIVKRLMEI